MGLEVCNKEGELLWIGIETGRMQTGRVTMEGPGACNKRARVNMGGTRPESCNERGKLLWRDRVCKKEKELPWKARGQKHVTNRTHYYGETWGQERVTKSKNC